jgi:hypothetical protein
MMKQIKIMAEFEQCGSFLNKFIVTVETNN